jgi:hypothetical protein
MVRAFDNYKFEYPWKLEKVLKRLSTGSQTDMTSELHAIIGVWLRGIYFMSK